MGGHKKVGKLDKKIIDIFGLLIPEGSVILCGKDNIEHMKNEHPEDFEKYGDKIQEIIDSPTYISKHPKKNSIEYIKVYPISDNDYVLVAVRALGKGNLFVRTLFVMDKEKVEKYKNKNVLKEY